MCVTLAERGAVCFVGQANSRTVGPHGPIASTRIALDPADQVPAAAGDTTGCGDVFGAAACAALLSGATTEDAFRTAARLAARNVTHRGATGLRDHLLGRLSGV